LVDMNIQALHAGARAAGQAESKTRELLTETQ
jgi:hypothetical protein